MISETEWAQVWHPEKRGFLFIDHREASVGRENRAYQWFAPATAAHRWRLEHVERFLSESVPAGSTQLQAQFEGCIAIRSPICSCCGDRPFRDLVCVRPDIDPVKRSYRCQKHRDRNPCAIEGCQRTRPAEGRWADDQHLCAEHWRRFVPPRSAARRAYHRFFRTAKKTDWTPELRRRFWRFWDGLVKRARRQSVEGRLDMTEINQMFGWGE